MIDTVVISCRVQNMRPGLDWQEEQKRNPNNTEWETKFHRNTALAQMTLFAAYADGRFTVQASLPTVLFGENVTLLRYFQVQEAWDKLYAYIVASAPAIKFPPIDEWKLNRVDWCYNWKVSSVYEYMNVLDKIMIGSRRHITVSHEDRRRGGRTRSVQTQNYWSAHAYDKESETRSKIASNKIDWSLCTMTREQMDEAARGLLRFEYRAKSKQLEKIFGHGNATVGALKREMRDTGLHSISEKWDELTQGWTSTSYDDALRLLREKHGNCAAGDLMDFWMHLREVGEVCYREASRISDSTWRRRKRKLEDAGVGFSSANGLERPLIDPFALH